MNERIENIIQQRREELERQYAPKEKQKWKANPPVISNTKIIAEKPPFPITINGEVLIRNDFATNFLGAIAIIFLGSFFFVLSHYKLGGYSSEGAIGIGFFCVLIGAFPLIRSLKRSTKIIIDQEGVWVKEQNVKVLWHTIVDTYIKSVDFDGEKNEYLIVHFFDEQKEWFESFECKLNHLEFEKEEIAFYIELFKEKAKTKAANFAV
jgi:hypothetical protein